MGMTTVASHRLLSEATARDPKAFPAPPSVSSEQFEEHVRARSASTSPRRRRWRGSRCRRPRHPRAGRSDRGEAAAVADNPGPVSWAAARAGRRSRRHRRRSGRAGQAGRGKKARHTVATGNGRRRGRCRSPRGWRSLCRMPDRAIVLCRRNLLRTKPSSTAQSRGRCTRWVTCAVRTTVPATAGLNDAAPGRTSGPAQRR